MAPHDKNSADLGPCQTTMSYIMNLQNHSLCTTRTSAHPKSCKTIISYMMYYVEKSSKRVLTESRMIYVASHHCVSQCRAIIIHRWHGRSNFWQSSSNAPELMPAWPSPSILVLSKWIITMHLQLRAPAAGKP